MNYFITISLSILLLVSISSKSEAFQQGSVEYSVPIDYSKLDESELSNAANKCFISVINMPESTEKTKEAESAKRHYKILSDMYPENFEYCIKLGIMYDLSGEDRHAKGCYSKSINMSREKAYPYYIFGNYYFRREQYRPALKMYKKSYKYGFSNHYFTLKNLAVIYEKLGDTRMALSFYNRLSKLAPNDKELKEKIRLLEDLNFGNLLYYQNSRIHTQR